jgi:glycosyltransferase involved in cell wall biosynthesis
MIVLVHANPVAPSFVMSVYSFLRKIVFRGALCISTSPNLLNKVKASGYVDARVIPLCIPEKPLPKTYVLDLPKRFALYFGRLAGYKGIPHLLDAAIDSPEVNFVIAGMGPLSTTVQKYISDYSLGNVLLINRFISDEEKLELIARCDFLVFPSTNQNEAFGLVQLEAMRYAKAIVNTWIDSGVNFVAPHGVCALTVKASDAKALSSAIRKLWDDHELAKRLGNSGRMRYLELFSESKFQSAWKSIIKGYVTRG